MAETEFRTVALEHSEISPVAVELRGDDPQNLLDVPVEILLQHDLGEPGIHDPLVLDVIVQRLDQLLTFRRHGRGRRKYRAGRR